jgi:hypothetical protein
MFNPASSYPAMLRASVLAVALMVRSASAQPTVSFNWGDGYAGPIQANNTPAQCALDSSGNLITTSSSQNSQTAFIAIRKAGLWDGQIWQTYISAPLGLTPKALAVAPNQNIFVGATYVDAYQNTQVAIYEFDPNGIRLSSQAYSSGYAGGVNLLGLFADAGGDLHVALAFPYANNRTYLDLKTVDGSFHPLGEITDMSIQPAAGFFQPGGSFFVTGSEPTSSPTGGARAEGFDVNGALLWSESFNNGSNSGGHWTYGASLYPSPNPGESLLELQETLVPTTGAIQKSFTSEYLGATGTALWTTPATSGQLLSAAVDSEGQTYLSYTTLTNNLTYYHLQGITGGAVTFTVGVVGSFGLGVTGLGSAFLAVDDPRYPGEVQLERISSAGSLSYKQTLGANMPGGGTTLVGNIDSLNQTGTGNLVLLGTAGADAYVAALTENPSLVKVAAPHVIDSKSFSSSVTLDAPAPAGGYTVNLTSSNLVLDQTSVTVPAGQTTATFTGKGGNVDLTSPDLVTGYGQDGSVKMGKNTVAGPKLLANNPGESGDLHGGDNWSDTLYFTVPTGPDGITVTMTSSNPTYVPNATFKIPGGVISAQVTGTTTKFDNTAQVYPQLVFTDPDGGVTSFTMDLHST